MWGAVSDSEPPLVEGEPACLALPSRRQLLTRLKVARRNNDCLNLHFFIEPKTYSDVPDWAKQVDTLLNDLNDGMSGDTEYLPTIVISESSHGSLPYNKDEGERAYYLRRIVDLTEKRK